MIVVVSDLHLSEGCRPETGKFAPTEDFFFDGLFARFLKRIDSSAAEPVHLIINGDLFDFLQVMITQEEIESSPHFADQPRKVREYIRKYGAKTDENSTIMKLEKVARGHRVFFEALGRFVAAGNRLTVVIGNHDIELFWPGVQACFRELLRVEEFAQTAADGAVLADNIEFSPWIFYDRDYRFYVEHGNQYEVVNSFRYGLYPVLPKKQSEINLPFGSLVVRYLLNRIEEINPFADNIKPNTKYVAWVFRNNPLGFKRLLKLLAQFFVMVAKSYRRSGSLSNYDAGDLVKFQEESDKRIESLSQRYGIVGDATSMEHPLRLIMALHKLPINDSKRRFLWRGLLSYVDVILFLLGGACAGIFLASAGIFGWPPAVSAVLLLGAILILFSGNVLYSVGSSMSKENLRAVTAIKCVMDESGNPVRYLTFGHTHEPEIEKVGEDGVYFNTGTWGVIFNDQEELIREKGQFAVLVLDEPGSIPRLVRWNDGLGDLEPLPIFDSR